MVSEKIARNILKTYEKAWIEQDVDKILSIFTKDGTYHEYAFRKPFVGHKTIARYWKIKVVKEQSNIVFKLLNLYICKNNIIAEWDASFDSNVKNCRYHIKQVAIMELSGNKIKHFREYWHSEKKPKKKF